MHLTEVLISTKQIRKICKQNNVFITQHKQAALILLFYKIIIADATLLTTLFI